MNNKTVKELKAIAKSKKIKGYYKMSKAQLIDVLQFLLFHEPKVKLTYKKGYPIKRVSNSTIPIIDEPVPDINTPIGKVPPKLKTLASRVAKQVKRKKDELVDLFSSKVPPPPPPPPILSAARKILNTKVKKLKEKTNEKTNEIYDEMKLKKKFHICVVKS